MVLIAVFVFGAVLGSFLNVCIVRLPAGESIVFPASHCPICKTPIRSYDNVPILAYLVLRGRCRACAARISPRYPFVEALTGLAAAAALLEFGWSVRFAVALLFLAALIVVTFIDLDHQIIPDVISLPGIPVGFAAAALTGAPGWQSSLIGILLGGGILWAVAEGYYRVTGREGMGGGDIKLLAMIGAFLGWRAVPITLVLGSLSGTVVGLVFILAKGRDSRTPIPFGPFLAASAVCALFFGDALIDWYLNLMSAGQ
jgi:leader peptidase (prepilin peptidase)/N-methyltransferase